MHSNLPCYLWSFGPRLNPQSPKNKQVTMSNSSNGNDIKRSMTAGGEASMASMASRETRRQKIFSNSSRLYLMVIPTAFICVLSAWSRLASVVAQSTTQVQKSPGQVKTRSKREDKRIRNATLQPPQKYISCAYDIPSTYNWVSFSFTAPTLCSDISRIQRLAASLRRQMNSLRVFIDHSTSHRMKMELSGCLVEICFPIWKGYQRGILWEIHKWEDYSGK